MVRAPGHFHLLGQLSENRRCRIPAILQSGSIVLTIQQVLLELELAGRVERHPGQKVALALTPPGAGDSAE